MPRTAIHNGPGQKAGLGPAVHRHAASNRLIMNLRPHCYHRLEHRMIPEILCQSLCIQRSHCHSLRPGGQLRLHGL